MQGIHAVIGCVKIVRSSIGSYWSGFKKIKEATLPQSLNAAQL